MSARAERWEDGQESRSSMKAGRVCKASSGVVWRPGEGGKVTGSRKMEVRATGWKSRHAPGHVARMGEPVTAG